MTMGAMVATRKLMMNRLLVLFMFAFVCRRSDVEFYVVRMLIF